MLRYYPDVSTFVGAGENQRTQNPKCALAKGRLSKGQEIPTATCLPRTAGFCSKRHSIRSRHRPQSLPAPHCSVTSATLNDFSANKLVMNSALMALQ